MGMGGGGAMRAWVELLLRPLLWLWLGIMWVADLNLRYGLLAFPLAMVVAVVLALAGCPCP